MKSNLTGIVLVICTLVGYTACSPNKKPSQSDKEPTSADKNWLSKTLGASLPPAIMQSLRELPSIDNNLQKIQSPEIVKEIYLDLSQSMAGYAAGVTEPQNNLFYKLLNAPGVPKYGFGSALGVAQPDPWPLNWKALDYKNPAKYSYNNNNYDDLFRFIVARQEAALTENGLEKATVSIVVTDGVQSQSENGNDADVNGALASVANWVRDKNTMQIKNGFAAYVVNSTFTGRYFSEYLRFSRQAQTRMDLRAAEKPLLVFVFFPNPNHYRNQWPTDWLTRLNTSEGLESMLFGDDKDKILAKLHIFPFPPALPDYRAYNISSMPSEDLGARRTVRDNALKSRVFRLEGGNDQLADWPEILEYKSPLLPPSTESDNSGKDSDRFKIPLLITLANELKNSGDTSQIMNGQNTFVEVRCLETTKKEFAKGEFKLAGDRAGISMQPEGEDHNLRLILSIPKLKARLEEGRRRIWLVSAVPVVEDVESSNEIIISDSKKTWNYYSNSNDSIPQDAATKVYKLSNFISPVLDLIPNKEAKVIQKYEPSYHLFITD